MSRPFRRRSWLVGGQQPPGGGGGGGVAAGCEAMIQPVGSMTIGVQVVGAVDKTFLDTNGKTGWALMTLGA